jgi:hypothetical protein
MHWVGLMVLVTLTVEQDVSELDTDEVGHVVGYKEPVTDTEGQWEELVVTLPERVALGQWEGETDTDPDLVTVGETE